MFIRKRAGKLHRLNQECKAYRSAVKQSSTQYDGHNGVEARVCWARLKDSPNLTKKDSAHNRFIESLDDLPLGDYND